MTIANTFATKASVAFVAIAMALMAVAPAQAATAEELQAQIDALMAQIAGLTAQTTTTTTGASCGYTFTRALTVGSQGADVTALQTYLIGAGHAIPAGATGYFGSQTQAAVAAWQTANGVMPAAGYFGPLSQAKYASVCVTTPTPTPSDDTTTSDDSTSTTDLQGEASLKDVTVKSGDDKNNVEEGSQDMQLADIDVEFNDGDAKITRLDVALQGRNTPTESRPWRVFGDVSLMVDGDVVATIDGSDQDNYLDDNDGSLRFSGLNIVGMEDETVTITVVANVDSSVDDAGTDADWSVRAGSLRFVDAEDVTSTETTTGDLDEGWAGRSADFSIDQAGAGDDLNLEDSDDNPDTATIKLSDKDNTEEPILAFNLSANDSDTDINLDNFISVNVTVATTGAGSNLDTLVNDFRLEIDGTSYDAESYTGTGNTATIDFDINGDETIAADEVKTATLYADFNDMATADEGSTIYASVAPADIDAEGDVSGETVTVDGSTITGNVQTLRTKGVAVTYSDDTVTGVENDTATKADNAADFTLKFNVKSFGDAVYLPFGAGTTSAMTKGVKYEIVNTNTNSVVAVGNATIPGVTAAGGSTVIKTNSFKVSGSDVLFTLNVNYDPAANGTYKLRLAKVNFASSDVSTATTAQDVSALNIETDAITIANN